MDKMIRDFSLMLSEKYPDPPMIPPDKKDNTKADNWYDFIVAWVALWKHNNEE